MEARADDNFKGSLFQVMPRDPKARTLIDARRELLRPRRA